MAKTLKDFLAKKNPLLKSKADQEFYKKNVSAKVTKLDKATENDDQFKANNVKTYNRAKNRHGVDGEEDTVSDGTALNEISKDLATRYLDKLSSKMKSYNKTSDKLNKARTDAEYERLGGEKEHSRITNKIIKHQVKGVNVAREKMTGRAKVPFSGKSNKTYDIVKKSLNELSKKTLSNYIRKASSDVQTKSFNAGALTNIGMKKDASNQYKKSFKRVAGINKATDRLVKENQIDESTRKEAITRYHKAAKERLDCIKDLLNKHHKNAITSKYPDLWSSKDVHRRIEDIHDDLVGRVDTTSLNEGRRALPPGFKNKGWNRNVSKPPSLKDLGIKKSDPVKDDKTEKKKKLDEISARTLSNYVRKALVNIKHHETLANKAADKSDDEYELGVGKESIKRRKAYDAEYVKHMNKSDKRHIGIKKANKRLNTEEALNELSKKTLASYIKQASDAKSGAFGGVTAGDKESMRHYLNRRKGIRRAADKLAKE